MDQLNHYNYQEDDLLLALKVLASSSLLSFSSSPGLKSLVSKHIHETGHQ